ncbi:MAG: tetratricopeptide repeat protein [Bradymonadales bacterium]|nr:tetratricopeptide repeat protein [Bradymonadales bacterium]
MSTPTPARPLVPDEKRRTQTRAGATAPCGLLAFYLICALVGLWVACHSPYQTGLDALAREDWVTARTQAEQGLSRFPLDGRLHLLYARAALGARDFLEAIEHASFALASGELATDDLGIAHLTMGEGHLGVDQQVDAALHLVLANNLGVRPNDQQLRHLVSLAADSALSADRPGDALRLLRALVRLQVESGEPLDQAGFDPRIIRAGQAHARQLAQAGEHESAVSMLAELASAYPTVPEVLLALGQLQLRMGRIEESAATFQTYLDSPGPQPRADRLEQVAQTAAQVYQWDLAASYLHRAIEENPDQVSSYLQLAELYFATARDREGSSILDRLVERILQTPTIPYSQSLIAAYQTALAAGHVGPALDYLERGFHHRPEIDLATTLAEVYLRREQRTRAETLLADFIAGSEDPALGAEAVGDWYHSRGSIADAIFYYRQALDGMEGPGDLYLKLGEAYAEIGWTYDLVSTLQTYVRSTGGDSTALRQAAELLERYQQWREAAQMLRSLVDIDPSEEIAWRLARAYYLGGEPQREREVYEALVQEAPEPGPMALQVARVLLDRGAYTDAVGWLERAIEDGCGDRSAYLELGRTYQMLVRFDEMWEAYQAFADRSGEPMQAYEEILALFDAPSFRTQAVELLERMLAMEPDRADLRLQLAERLLDGGDLRRTQQAYVDYILGAEDPTRAAQTVVWSLSRKQEQRLAAEVLHQVHTRRPRLAGVYLASARLHLDLARGAATARQLQQEQVYLASARRDYQEFLEAGVEDAWLMVQTASTIANAGFFDLAAQAYQRANRLGAPGEAFRKDHARSLILGGGDIDLAVAMLSEEIQNDPEPATLALDSAELLAGQGYLPQAVDLAAQALSLATTDEGRARAFEVGADLLVEDGGARQLVHLANRYVESSQDQLSALNRSAPRLAEIGLYSQARTRLEMALSLAPQQTDSIEELGRIDLLEGDIHSAFTRFGELAARSPSPWRAWWSYARLFEQSFRFDLSLRALQNAREAGGNTPELLVDLGRVHACLAQVAEAEESFETAMDRVERQARSATRRRQLFDRILQSYALVGRHDLVDRTLQWVLSESDLRSAYLLQAAKQALERGETDRGRQLLRAHLDEGGDLTAALETEMAHGHSQEALVRIGHLILTGNVEEAVRLLDLHFERAAAQVPGQTLSLWIDALQERGGNVRPLRVRQAAQLASSGQWQQGLEILSTLDSATGSELTERATLSALVGGLAPFGLAWIYLESMARSENEHSIDQIRSILALAEVLGDPEQIEAGLAAATDRIEATPILLARLDWLLTHGQSHPALDLVERLDPLTVQPQSVLFRSSSPSEVLATAIELFADHGFVTEAVQLAEREIQTAEGPDALFCVAARHAYEMGQTERVDALLSRYLELAAGHVPSLMAMGRALAQAGAAQQVVTLLEAILATGSEQQSREALQLVIHACLLGDRPDLAQSAIELATSRVAGRYRQLLAEAQYQEMLGRWDLAADRYLQAVERIAGRPAPLAQAVQLLVRSDQPERILSLLDRAGGPVLHRREILAALDRPAVAILEPELTLSLRERMSTIIPGSFEQRAELMTALIDQGQLAQAADLLAQLERLVPQEPINRHLLLRSLGSAPNSIAAGYARSLLSEADLDWRSLLQSIEILKENGQQPEGALESLTATLEQAHLPPGQIVEVARMLLDWGRPDLAVELTTRAIERRPDLPTPYALRAAALVYQGQLGQAQSDLDRYLSTAFNPTWGQDLVARALLVTDREEEGNPLLLDMARSVEFTPNGPRLAGLSRVLDAFHDTGHSAEGQDFVQTHFPRLRLFPATLGDPGPLALILEETEGDQAAIELYRRALQQRGDDPTLLLGLANLLADSGSNLDEALRLAYRALGTNLQYSPDLLATLARINRLRGSNDTARLQSRAALDLLDAADPDFRRRAALLIDLVRQQELSD